MSDNQVMEMENINLKVPANIYRTVSDLFETKEGMLKNFLFSIAIAKVSDYRKRGEIYEKKYSQSFRKFEKMVLDRDRKENFEEWDDYIRNALSNDIRSYSN